MQTVWIYTAPRPAGDASAAVRRLLCAAWAELQPGRALPQIRTFPDGKPDFAGGDWHFSLSHGRTLLAAALCCRPVGVDVETLRPVHPRLFTRVTAPQEQTWLAGQPDPDRAFLQLWTLKEAFLKYTGTGLQGLPRDLCFQPAGEGFCLQGHPEICTGTSLLQGSVLSWCTDSPACCVLREYAAPV